MYRLATCFWVSIRTVSPQGLSAAPTPLFPEMKMQLSNGNTFTVLAPAVSRENIYIQSVKLDGKPYDKSYITHEQIMGGATLEFDMDNTPGPVWYK